jgi:hypothetical protein
MAKKSFFHNSGSDPIFLNTKAAKNYYSQKGRANCERLWELYEPYCDSQFLIEVGRNFSARYWEMYLTCFLIEQGYEVCCPKPGPDVGIDVDGRRIWFEATSPTPGNIGALDQVPEWKNGEVNFVPNEKIVLRYLNSISEKYRQHVSWAENGIVDPSDGYVIAINPSQLGFEYADTTPPRILQAAFQVGNLYAKLNPSTGKIIEKGYEFRSAIAKVSGTMVSTGVFQNPEYQNISALLCSRVDAVNQPDKMGEDFQLVPNPTAANPLPGTFRLNGIYFRAEQLNGNLTVFSEKMGG